jgi:amino-acid N-acetyltransferase
MRVCEKNSQILDQVSQLLKDAGLVPIGLEEEKLQLFCEQDKNDEVLGVVGLEIYGTAAILRSLAVQEDMRKQGIGRRLLSEVFVFEKNNEITELYLMTETIGKMLEQSYGFSYIGREKVPGDMAQSPLFKDVCHCSCAVMVKQLGGELGV